MKVLINSHQIRVRVAQMASEILDDAKADKVERLHVVPLLSGSLPFCADLIRELPIRLEIHPLCVRSYTGTKSGDVFLEDMNFPYEELRGKHVLIVDDILDTGQTLRTVVSAMWRSASPAGLRTAVLLDKNKQVHVGLSYQGFSIPDEFVVGFGMDYKGLYRNLPDICVWEGTDE